MPWWSVLLGLVAAVLLGWLVLGWLFGEADQAAQPDTRAQLRIDAIRTGLAVVAGTGGGVALLLAARRQWLSERAQRHREQMSAAEQTHRERVQEHDETVAKTEHELRERQAGTAEHDATERRVTELYTKAVELLGSDSAAVRLGGLYALERLAEGNAKQRTTIVAVVCAYLRMPAADESPRETEVRRSAQRMLGRHLRAEDEDAYWPGMRLELAGAHLTDFDASRCTLVEADFSGAVFAGHTNFAGATLRGRLLMPAAAFDTATFDEVHGDAEVLLDDARWQGEASFRRAEFGGRFSCRRARFDRVYFSAATMRQPASVDGTRFDGDASFRQAVFEAGLSVEHAEFAAYAGFRMARFADMVFFRWTVFRQGVNFERAVFEGALNLARAQFLGVTTFEGATLQRKPMADQARATATDAHVWPAKLKVSRLDDDWLVMTDS